MLKIRRYQASDHNEVRYVFLLCRDKWIYSLSHPVAVYFFGHTATPMWR